MNYEEILSHQEEFFQRIKSSPCKTDLLANKQYFWKQIEKYLFQNIEDLGSLGQKIKNFIDNLDLNHPDLEDFYNKNFIKNEEDFGKIILDYLKVCCLIKSNIKSSYVLKIFKDSFFKDLKYEELNRNIDSPLCNQIGVRFLKNRQDRDKVRSTKKFQNITIDNYSKNELPNSFTEYGRYKNLYEKKIKEALKVKENFINHGLCFMAEEMDKNIFEIKNEIEKNSNFGFNRISLLFAAKLAAKVCGFEIDDEQKIFINLPNDSQKFILNAKVYTLQELKDKTPDSIVKIIDYLESFPDLNYRPIFDHYRVVIPCIKPKEQTISKTFFEYEDVSGKKFDIFDYEEYQKLINLDLIYQKKIIGILLGERDGDHFFVSYFI